MRNQTRSTADNSSRALVDRLARSKMYRDYERAFCGATGLPFVLAPPESPGLPLRGAPNENPFCRAMAEWGPTCAACLELQRQLTARAAGEATTLRCFAGLCDSAAPVKLGHRLLGFLRTGQIMTTAPTEADFARATQSLLPEACRDHDGPWPETTRPAGSVNIDLERLREVYFASRVLEPARYEAMVRLLKVFAEHLSLACNEVLVREEQHEHPLIERAKEFIALNQGEDLSLPVVARAVNTSTFYFCKMFKKATGFTFTDYLGRVRVERAKTSLLDPHTRVSEVAFEVGFQSLSQFNRVFKRVTGLSPTGYRERLPRAPAPAVENRPEA